MAFQQQAWFVPSTLAISSLATIMGGLADWNLHKFECGYSQLLAEYHTRPQAVEKMRLVCEQMQKSLGQFVLTGNRCFLVSMSRCKLNVDDWIGRAEELARSVKKRVFAGKTRSSHEQFLVELDHIKNRVLLPEYLHAAVSARNSDSKQTVLLPTRQSQRFNRDRRGEQRPHTQTLTNRLGLTLFLVGVSGALGGLLVAFIVARGVQRRLLANQRAVSRSEHLATLGRVATALAHELRNPLTSMRLIVQSARADEKQVSLDARDFSILEQEIERLDSSLQAFLDYARPPRPAICPCVVQSLVRQAIAIVERRAAQIGATIRDELPVDPIEFEADPGQVRQVIRLILINALDASPSGGTITLRSRVTKLPRGHGASCKRPCGGAFVEIEIIDDGVGLPHDLGDHIFDAFVSVKESGLGLGLAICKRIINDHGGKLDARDGQNGGAVITLLLPKIHRSTIQKASITGPALGH